MPKGLIKFTNSHDPELIEKVTNVNGDLAGRVCVITGSTSGIGRGCAILFASEGAKVVVVGRKNGDVVVDLIKEAGGEAIFVETDLTSEESIAAMMKTAADTYGKIDVLVNVAGMSRVGFIEDFDLETFNKMMTINCIAPFLTAKYAMPYLLESEHAVIVNVLSHAANFSMPIVGMYGATKAAALNLTKNLAKMYGWKGIRVNGICPGSIWTPMNDGFGMEGRDWTKHNPMGYYGTTEDIAQMALFMASDKSTYMHGQIVNIDGGVNDK